MESAMRNFFQITTPKNQEENPESHETKVLFLGTPGKQESERNATLRNISELEEPPEDPDNQGMMTYIKKLAIYVSDLAASFFGFARYAEASALVLGEDLERICIQTKAASGRLVQYKEIDWEYGTVWEAI